MPNRFATLALLLAVPSIALAAPPSRLFETRGAVVLDGVPTPDPALAEPLAGYLAAREARFVDWLPDGAMLIATRFGETTQLHRLGAPLGAREQLTFLADPVREASAPAVAAGAGGFAFLADHGGDENAQLYYYDFADHRTRLLSDGKSLHGGLLWAPDGRRIAFQGTARDGASHDIYVAEPAAGTTPRLLVSGAGGLWTPLDWSYDGARLLLQRYVSARESHLYVADVASGALTPVDVAEEPERHFIGRRKAVRSGTASFGPARFAPDGRGILLVTDEGSEFRELRYFDPFTKESRVLGGHVSGDVTSFDVSADGRYVAWVASVEGASRLAVTDTVQMLDLALPALPPGVIERVRFDRTGRRLALTLAPGDAPCDVYAVDLEHAALVRWTQSELGPIDARRIVAAQLVHYPSWDRAQGAARPVAAYVYRPAAGSGSRHPVLISLHDGPAEEYLPTYDPFVEFLVNELGYIVVAPNVRGSSGYGRTYRGLADGLLREDAVRDVGSLLVWLGLQPDVDRDHVVVSGRGYGGYLALASLAAYPDRLRGGIDFSGISDFVSFLEHTGASARDLARQEYGDERDTATRTYLHRISPLTNAASIRGPVLVVRGLADSRIPPAQSQDIVSLLRARGGDAWLLSVQEEGHVLERKADRDFCLLVEATFLERLAH